MIMKTIFAAAALLSTFAGVTPAPAQHVEGYASGGRPRADATREGRSSFYPDHTRGGVDGNLSFNNQIRKHTDGLNANGAGH